MKPLRNSFRELAITNDDKVEIIQHLAELCFLRAEEVTDYDFEIWLNYWAENGYSKEQVLEMIELGKKLPKFGTIKLAIGDLITTWEKKQETIHNISWTAFQQCLNELLKKDLKLLDKVSQELLGLNWIDVKDKTRMYNFMLWQIEQIKKEKDTVEVQDNLYKSECAINYFEKIKQDTAKQNKAFEYIKTELLLQAKKIREYFESDCIEHVPITGIENGQKVHLKDYTGQPMYGRKFLGEIFLSYMFRLISSLEKVK